LQNIASPLVSVNFDIETFTNDDANNAGGATNLAQYMAVKMA
jgi:hypothetical protein